MKTLLNISPEVLMKVQVLFNLKTKTEAVRFALNEVIRRKELEDLADQLGAFDEFITSKELLKARKQNDTTRIFCLD